MRTCTYVKVFEGEVGKDAVFSAEVAMQAATYQDEQECIQPDFFCRHVVFPRDGFRKGIQRHFFRELKTKAQFRFKYVEVAIDHDGRCAEGLIIDLDPEGTFMIPKKNVTIFPVAFLELGSRACLRSIQAPNAGRVHSRNLHALKVVSLIDAQLMEAEHSRLEVHDKKCTRNPCPLTSDVARSQFLWIYDVSLRCLLVYRNCMNMVLLMDPRLETPSGEGQTLMDGNFGSDAAKHVLFRQDTAILAKLILGTHVYPEILTGAKEKSTVLEIALSPQNDDSGLFILADKAFILSHGIFDLG